MKMSIVLIILMILLLTSCDLLENRIFKEETIDVITVDIISTLGDKIDEPTIPVKIRFSQKVTDFTTNDITVTNGSVLNLTTYDNKNYNAEISYDDSYVTIQVPVGAAEPEDGGLTEASEKLFISIERIPPAVTITSNLDAKSYIDSFDVNILFSEEVSSFDITDITVINGTATNLRRTDNFKYTAVITPTDDTVTCYIAERSVVDSNNNFNTESEDLIVSILESLLGEISGLTWSNDENYVYACDKTNNLIYKIDIYNEKIVSSFDLFYETPVSMVYSKSKNKLYIAYAQSDYIEVFNLATETFETEITMGLAYNNQNKEIEIDEVNSKLFILTYSRLTIIDLDTGLILLDEDISVEGSRMEIDPDRELLFTTDRGYSPSSMYRYSYSSNVLVLQESTRNIGSNGRDIVLSPDKSVICRPAGGGNGSGYTVYAIDPLDFKNVYGEWNIGTYPSYVFFNPVTDVLYGTNGDPYDETLYVVDTNTYAFKNKFSFPNSNDYTIFTTNITGTKAIGFSYNSYYDNNYKFYYFDQI